MSSKLQITPAECRLRAAECHKMAHNARRPHVRETLAEIERMWIRLAVEAEVSLYAHPLTRRHGLRT